MLKEREWVILISEPAPQLLGYFCPYILNILYVLCLVYYILVGRESVSMFSCLEVTWVSYSTMFHVLLVNRATQATSEVSDS